MRYRDLYGYLRLSRDDEDSKDESNSITNQRLMIQQYVDADEELCGAKIRFFVDDGYSGTNYMRPGFQEMMELVRAGESCCIFVKDLSRLGRDTVDTQNYIEKIFPFLQVRFIAISDHYDSQDSAASSKDMEVKFKNLVNGIYPRICSQNIKQTKRKQAEIGKYQGTIPTYGYQFQGTDRSALILDKEVSWVVRLIFDKRLAGDSYSAIARELNKKGIITPAEYQRNKGYVCLNKNVAPLWTAGSVKAILTNPAYTGAVVNHKTENAIVAVKSAVKIPKEQWISVPGMHEAIISQQELDQVLSMIKPGKQYPAAKIPKNIFRGKLRCGYCKRLLRVRHDWKKARAYCYTPNWSDETACYKHSFYLSEVESVILALVKQQAALADDTMKKMKALNKTLDISKLKKELETHEAKIRQIDLEKMSLYEQFVSGEISKETFMKQKVELTQEAASYKEKAESLWEQIKQADAGKKKISSPILQEFAKYVDLDELSYPIVQELIDVIYFYNPERLEVVWKYRDEFQEIVDISDQECTGLCNKKNKTGDET